MPLLLSAPHHTIHRMTPDERRTTRIVTRSMAGDVLLPSMPRPTEAKSNAAEPAARPTAVKLDTVGPAKPEAIAPAPRVTEAMPDMAEAAARPTEVNLSSAEPAAPKAAAAEAAPASSPAAEAAAKVVADLMLLYPPGGDTVDIFIRVRPLDQSAPAAHYTAYLGFAHGSKLTARSTGDGAADPLYAALGSQDFCRLHRTGNLSIKVALESDARPGRPLQMASDMSKAPGALEFAAKNCGG
jgi:hypothetical protein